jgi:hypothetical protein
MRKTIVFVLGLLLGAAVVLLLHPRSANGSGPTYISRFKNVSNYLPNHSEIIFGDVKGISCVVEEGNTVCYVLSQ